MINNDIQYDIQCEGIQTISEDGITIISESLIAFGLSGYLMLFNLNSCKVVDKIFLDASMIKCIFTKKVPKKMLFGSSVFGRPVIILHFPFELINIE